MATAQLSRPPPLARPIRRLARWPRVSWRYALILAWLVAPAVLWLVSAPLAARFGSVASALSSTAIVLAFVGFAGFGTNLMIGARIPGCERIFGDLGRAYRVHRVVGYGVPILLIAHGLLMVASRATYALDAAAMLLTPAAGGAIFLGVVALVALVAVLFSPLVLRLPHEQFVRLHRAVGMVFILAVLHVFFVPGAGGLSLALRTYLGIVATAGAAAWLYRSVLGRFLVPRYRYRVEAVNLIGASAVEFVLAPRGNQLTHRPGQFAFLTVVDGSLPREAHPFSIASAPESSRRRFVVKALGDFTRRLPGLPLGAAVEIEGPYGRFTPAAGSNARQVWIAGGIGITPFLSMARSLDATDASSLEIDLYYCTERAGEDVFLDELYAIADRNPRFRVVPVRKTSLGHITAEDVRAASPVIRSDDVFICGPPAMQRSLTSQLRALGVPAQQIHFEDFGALSR